MKIGYPVLYKYSEVDGSDCWQLTTVDKVSVDYIGTMLTLETGQIISLDEDGYSDFISPPF
jgi:hypothetical protein